MPRTPKSPSAHRPVPLALAVRTCYQGRLTQEELAARLGVHQTKVSKWATGTMRPTLEEIAAMEEACGRRRGFVLALSGHVTAAGLSEGHARLVEERRRTRYEIAAEKGGKANLARVVRGSSRARPRAGATPLAPDDA